MANCIWRGDAPAVAQVDTLTPGGTIEADDLFNVTLENRGGEKHTLSVAAGGTAAADVVDAIVAEAAALKAAETDPWDEVTVADDGNTATITADTAGEPFWCTVETTEANGDAADSQTFSVAETTACAGPHIFDTAENWSGAALPGTGDKAIIPADATVAIYGSDGTEAVFDKLEVEACDIAIGSAAKPLLLTFASETNATVELSGTGRIFLGLTEAKAVTVKAAGASPGEGLYATNIISDSATNNPTLNIACEANQSVSVGANAGEAAEFASIRVSGGEVVIGDTVTESDGSTAPDIIVSGGDTICHSAIGSFTQTGGKFRQQAGAITTANVNGGALYYNSSGTLDTATVKNDGKLDFSEDLVAKTCTTCTLHKTGTVHDPNKVVTFTNGIAVGEGCTIQAA